MSFFQTLYEHFKLTKTNLRAFSNTPYTNITVSVELIINFFELVIFIETLYKLFNLQKTTYKLLLILLTLISQ